MPLPVEQSSQIAEVFALRAYCKQTVFSVSSLAQRRALAVVSVLPPPRLRVRPLGLTAPLDEN